MGKLGVRWPADVRTVSLLCQLLLGVPISYIHFLMNCFIICTGEFLILQIFNVTRHLDSVAFSLYLTISISFWSSPCTLVCTMCTFWKDNTGSAEERGFFKDWGLTLLFSLNSLSWALLCFKWQEDQEWKLLKKAYLTQALAAPHIPVARSLCS